MLAGTGPTSTVRQPAHAPTPPSELVTVTFRGPVGALVTTLTRTVRVVEFTTIGLVRATPEPDTETVAPVTKLVPVIVASSLVTPWPK